jgi:hypothetical protein
MEQIITSPKPGTINRKTGAIASRSVLDAILLSLAFVWQKIRDGVWRARNSLAFDIAKPLDVERICTQLAVVRRAEEDAARNLPPSSEEVPGGMQRQIIAYFTNLRSRARQQAVEDAEKRTRTFERIDIADALAQLRNIPAGCENRILRYVADSQSRLDHALEREQNQRKHYNAFRKKHGLDRVACYQGSGNYFYLIVPLLVMVLAVALSRTVGSVSAGVSGTWIAAVSAAAVVVPYMLGDSILRWINHTGKLRRFTGWVGASAAIAAIAAAAFYADLQLAAWIANPEASSRDAINAMMAAPVDVISTVENWAAFGLVGLTGLLALLLAYRSDDAYPGYGEVQRACYRARDAREEVSARLRKRINALVDESAAEVYTLSKNFKEKVGTYTKMVEKSERTPAALSDYDCELEDTCNVVLDRYRAANAAARRSVSPLSFNEHICFNPDNETDNLQASNGRGNVTDLQAAVTALEESADLARQNLRALNLRMINSVSESQLIDGDQAA